MNVIKRLQRFFDRTIPAWVAAVAAIFALVLSAVLAVVLFWHLMVWAPLTPTVYRFAALNASLFVVAYLKQWSAKQ